MDGLSARADLSDPPFGFPNFGSIRSPGAGLRPGRSCGSARKSNIFERPPNVGSRRPRLSTLGSASSFAPHRICLDRKRGRIINLMAAD
jgi:hypothetical protein